ncbi:MAG: hypothetical protein D6776_02820, partial [Planctomycetota bacterium]
SVERGEDPRERALVAFGGAGGLLAGELVRSLGLRGALVPPEPGVLSALGMAGAPLTLRLAETLLEPLEPAGRKRLAEAFARLERQAREQLGREGSASSLRWIRELDLRYAGQGHSVRIVWRPGEERARFEAEHRRRNGFTEPDRPIELVCARLTAVLAPHDDAAANAAPAPPPTGTRSRAAPPAVGATRHGPVHERAALAPGDTLPGPAIVTEYSGTTVVPDGMVLRVLADGGLWIEERER